MRHETPIGIAKVLARHVPRKIKSILDPCVGLGALLEPILYRTGTELTDVTCLDIDPTVGESIKERFASTFTGKLRVLSDDFISWGIKTKKRFDCIVMNPPFAGKKTAWTKIPHGVNSNHKKTPIEGEFIRIALSLLKPDGVLLGIIPSSVTCGTSLIWLRKELLKQGSIKYIHELPGYSFPGIEGRMYLIVYKKGVLHNNMVLLNHDLFEPEKMILSCNKLGKDLRFDYGYHSAMKNLLDLEYSTPHLGWRRFGDVAEVFQGHARSPNGSMYAIHSTDYHKGFWQNKNKHSDILVSRCALSTDILLQRLGRNCSKSFGLLKNSKPIPCTDYVWILRPKQHELLLPLLFTLRSLTHFSWFSAILERGVGARYIVSYDIENIRIPLSLVHYYQKKFTEYRKFTEIRDSCKMEKIEISIQQSLSEYIVK